MKTLEKNGTRTREMVTISRTEYEKYEAQKAELTELRSQNDWLLEQLRLANKKRFGTSSEKVREELMGQLRLTFNEAEAYCTPPGTKTTVVAAHTQRKCSPRLEEVLPENVPVVVKVEKSPTVIPSSFVSPEAIAYIMVQKFCMGNPLYR